MRQQTTVSRTGIRGRRRILFGAAPAALALTFAPPAYAQVQTISFNIESQPLSSALLAFGRQANLSILASSSLVEGKQAPAVRGQLSAVDALERLLNGSGLTYAFVQTNAVRIVAKDQAALQPVSTPAVDPDDDSDRVVVTGTNISGVAPASQVSIYSAEDINRSGATTTEQFVSKIPQNHGGVTQFAPGASATGLNTEGVNAVDLRGLGLGTTLTLLNGHRMSLANGGRSADVSMIPAAAIDRVEVLADGASAIYGSDAIGGVINFVLRDDFEGAETRLSYGGVSRGGLRQADASQTFGARWDGGHGLLSYNWRSASALKTTDRDYAVPAGPGNLMPVDIRHNLFLTASQDLTDKLTLDVDLGASRRKVKGSFSNLSSPILTDQTVAKYKSEADQIFGTLELDYTPFDDLTLTLSATYSELDNDSAASIVFVNAVPQTSNFLDARSNNTQLDVMAKADGSLLALPAGDVRFSLGAGVLEETYKGINPTTKAQSAGELGRRSPYAFAEIFAPLLGPEQGIPFARRLSLSLAARYTDYQETSRPSFNRNFGDSVDPKLGLIWEPVESLTLRGTYGSSFRAPSLTELDTTGGAHYLFPISVAGSPSILLGLTGYAESDLKAETAETYTLGFDFDSESLPGFRLSGTYYNIDYKDRIGTAPAGGLNPFASPTLLPDLIYHPPSRDFIADALQATPLLFNLSGVDVSNPATGADALFARSDVWVYDTRTKNLAISRQDGFDLLASQDFQTTWGDVQLGLNATHILKYAQQGSPTSAVLSGVDAPGKPVDWRGRAFMNWSLADFSGALNVNYVDSYQNKQAPVGQQEVDSWTTVDLSLAYSFGRSAGQPADGPRLSLSVQNLFDKDPPFLSSDFGSSIVFPIGFDPANANPLGRLIVLGFSQTW